MITGERSDWPTSLDDWGNEEENNVCQKLTAEYWNKIQDAVYNLERYTYRILKAGNASLPSNTSTNRPGWLMKTYEVTLAGADSEVKTATLPAFTSQEKEAFKGFPLHPQNVVIIQIRKKGPTRSGEDIYLASMKAPLTDYSGDSGWKVMVSNLLDRGDTYKVAAGNYVLTVVIYSG